MEPPLRYCNESASRRDGILFLSHLEDFSAMQLTLSSSVRLMRRLVCPGGFSIFVS